MPRAADPLTTRRRLPPWDRLKFIIALGLLWLVLVWWEMSNDQILGFRDSVRLTARSFWWVLALLGLEVVRQLHFLVSEHCTGPPTIGSGPTASSAGPNGQATC